MRYYTQFFQRNRLAWPHRRQRLASDGVRYAGARSSVGRRFRSATKLRLEWYEGVFLLLQQRSKHPREIVKRPRRQPHISLYGTCASPVVRSSSRIGRRLEGDTVGWPLHDIVEWQNRGGQGGTIYCAILIAKYTVGRLQ